MKFENGGSMNDLPTADDVMNYKQLSVYLKMGETTLRQKVMKGTIPSLKIDGAVRFSKTEIDEWLKGCKRKTPENKTTETETSEIKTDLFPVDGGNE